MNSQIPSRKSVHLPSYAVTKLSARIEAYQNILLETKKKFRIPDLSFQLQIRNIDQEITRNLNSKAYLLPR